MSARESYENDKTDNDKNQTTRIVIGTDGAVKLPICPVCNFPITDAKNFAVQTNAATELSANNEIKQINK